ncbi:MAG: HNH endonuclease [Chloroflexota bacterium]|nr:HNH endonuclease [Chloroflexota bacterium]
MRRHKLIDAVAETDATFNRTDGQWLGKCLICNGRLTFDERTGVGANLEHIVPRSRGGTNDLSNLGLTHPSCNAEKGRNWDAQRRRRDPDEYNQLLRRLQERRFSRWRAPTTGR